MDWVAPPPWNIHLAMSTQRIKKNEPVEVLDDAIWMDVKNNKKFELSKKMFENLKLKSPVSIPDSEKKFILMHICNLLQD